MDENQTPNQTLTDEQTTASIITSQIQESEEDVKKKMEAILAMEGEEGRLRREKVEKEKEEAGMVAKLEEEKSEINKKLEETSKNKEELEIKWIDLSEKMKELQKILEPIKENEARLEKDIQSKNQEEHATEDILTRQGFEKERQVLEADRQKIEKEKWEIEGKVLEINGLMAENKAKFQKILDEEYSFFDKIKEIDLKIKSIKIV